MKTIKNKNETIKMLGDRLRSNRISRHDTQEAAATRIGISLSTYKKMEQGINNTKLENWVNAAFIYGDVNIFEELFPQSLFDQSANRQRVARCKR
ncbi:MAG: helix-turn-helix transcriptional regulator [Methylococcales bacterium]|jgi:transcriptional regulator with XRE-family HTH domain|nr:helix-turn-helix transcriptional regulator [Methylococcales bacterium]MBT7408313.1 helix-turn-helix transcriptional regulator [Methylococcales bacterium]